ncbi:MAG TPA: RDD family protein [Acidimicrobiia bacterium]|nr:RDD family protein [Acidimicrobiia bacterium]
MAPDAASGLDAGLHVVTPPEQPAWPSGQYAGPATRLAAYAVDVAVSTVLLGVLTVGAIVAFDLVTGARIEIRVAAEVGAPATAVWLFLYYFVSWATVGKTPGMALLGLRVTRRDGEAVRTGQAAVRTLAFPLSFIGGLGFVGIVIGREHRALHDVVAGTTVLYD